MINKSVVKATESEYLHCDSKRTINESVNGEDDQC